MVKYVQTCYQILFCARETWTIDQQDMTGITAVGIEFVKQWSLYGRKYFKRSQNNTESTL